tara:strand:- start:140 stop:490 length:351 start_codon:yes stop_codon:yes gene_type:complete
MRRSQSGKEGQAEQGRGKANATLYLNRPLALCAHATPLMVHVVAAILLVASTVEESVYGTKVDDGNDERDHRAEQNEGTGASRWHARARQIQTDHADEARKGDESGSSTGCVVEAC